jgi:hypothetical protein
MPGLTLAGRFSFGKHTVLTALQKDAALRYTSASALLEDLERILPAGRHGGSDRSLS